MNRATIALGCEFPCRFTHIGITWYYVALKNVQYQVNDHRADFGIYMKQ